MEIKGQLLVDETDGFLLQKKKKNIACSTCFGHYYAHHQKLKSIIQMVAACGTWCLGFQVAGLVWS